MQKAKPSGRRIRSSGINKPIGVAEYQLVRAPPEPLDTSMPTIEEIEAELAGDTLPDDGIERAAP